MRSLSCIVKKNSFLFSRCLLYLRVMNGFSTSVSLYLQDDTDMTVVTFEDV